MRTTTTSRVRKTASPEAKAPSSLRSAGALHTHRPASPIRAKDNSPGPRPGNPANQNSSSPEGAEETELPEGWADASVGELIEAGKLWVKNGYADGRFNSDGIGVPHLRTFNISDAGELDLSQIKSVTPPPPADPHWLHCGDVIFNNTNSEELVGKTALFDFVGEFVLSNHMTILRVLDRERLEPGFLARSLHRKWVAGEAQMLCRRHVNQASINLDRLRGVRLLLPPLSEQRAIAGVLRTVQGAQAACARVLAAARQLKQSLLHHFFTYGPVPFPQAAHVPLKETEIGPMPEHWQIQKLGDVANMHTGGTPSRANPAFWDGGIPWVKTGEVNYNVIRQTEETISEEGLRNSAARLVPAGTLLVAMYGQGVTRGRVAILGIEATINQACAAVFPAEAVTTELLYNVFVHGYERIRNMGHGAHQTNLSMTLLERVLVPIPPLSEQREIARQLGAVDAKLAALESRRAALAALFRSLLHHLLTARLRLPAALRADPAQAGLPEFAATTR